MNLLGIVASPFAPYIAGGAAVALIGGILWVDIGAYNRGAAHERLAWQATAAKAVTDAQALALERQLRANDAATAKAERDRVYALARTPITNEVTRYVQTPAGAAVCVDADGVRLGSAAIAAANAATAAAGGRDAGVRPAAADVHDRRPGGRMGG